MNGSRVRGKGKETHGERISRNEINEGYAVGGIDIVGCKRLRAKARSGAGPGNLGQSATFRENESKLGAE